jgi:hypothetical protein
VVPPAKAPLRACPRRYATLLSGWLRARQEVIPCKDLQSVIATANPLQPRSLATFGDSNYSDASSKAPRERIVISQFWPYLNGTRPMDQCTQPSTGAPGGGGTCPRAIDLRSVSQEVVIDE